MYEVRIEDDPPKLFRNFLDVMKNCFDNIKIYCSRNRGLTGAHKQ